MILLYCSLSVYAQNPIKLYFYLYALNSLISICSPLNALSSLDLIYLKYEQQIQIQETLEMKRSLRLLLLYCLER